MSIIEKKFTATIPKGYEIVNNGVRVVGVFKRLTYVKEFVRGKDQTLSFEPERESHHDNNAIAVYGSYTKKSLMLFSSTKKTLLGYIPKDIAQHISDNNLITLIQPHLTCACATKDGCSVEFSIAIPY